MRRKFTILMVGLLLAVGWTNSAQAQRLPESDRAPMFKSATTEKIKASVDDKKNSLATLLPQASNPGMNAPMKAPLRTPNTITADVTHTRSWYDGKTYTWYPSLQSGTAGITANYTDVATDPYQMAFLVMNLYMDPTMPGIQYNEAYHQLARYPNIGHGWGITGNYFDDVTITTSGSNAVIAAIIISDGNDNELAEWYPANQEAFPSNWSSSKTIRTTTYTDNNNTGYRCAYMTNGGTITIPSSEFSSSTTGKINIMVYSARNNSSAATIQFGGATATLTNVWSGWNIDVSSQVERPRENGYSVLLVKVKDDATDFPYTTSTATGLIDSCFSKYESIELLTDGLRVGEGTSNAGTVFAYTGTLNRFFYISKGKTAQFTEYAPFYLMYEEFSPTTTDEGAEITDFYEKMKQGETYNIIHDCESVSFREHYFSMSGKEGTTHNLVNSLVLYIPDDRSKSPSSEGYVSRDYDHQPTVGMYMIDLYADIAPSQTQDDYYTVTVDWHDNLDEITHSDNIPQTYYLYEIRDKDGDGVMDTTLVTPNGTSQATWTYDYPVGDPSYYDIYYYVIGTPTQATNQDTFFAKSNTDDVTVPGKYDFLGLQWWRYESDYVTDDGENQEVNYYRNWLAPHALAVQGETGITAGNVGTTGRTLTLYRDDNKGNVIPVIDLELVMDGNKAYYRIKKRPNTQVIEPGYDENGEKDTNN
jgi:hypothetical protein